MVGGKKVEVEGEAGFDLPEALCPPLAKLLEYWQSLRPANGQIPSKRLFDPLDLNGLWHGLQVLQFTDPSANMDAIKIRYSGEHVDTLHGCSMVGRNLSQVLDETEYRRNIPSIKRAAMEGVPHFRRGTRRRGRHDVVEFERLFVPFCDEDGCGAYLIGMWHFPQPEHGSVQRLSNGVHMISSRFPAPRLS
jgi:hypothetical protein